MNMFVHICTRNVIMHIQTKLLAKLSYYTTLCSSENQCVKAELS